jgi:hypothetical protein
MTFLIFCRYVQCTFHEAVIKSYELSCRCSLHSLHHHFCPQNLSNTRPPSLDIYLSAMPSTAKQNCPERTTLPPLADPDEIRLLCLLPGGFGERIICTTIHVKLSENFQAEPPASLPLCNRLVDVHCPETARHRPQYEALSYV